MIKEVVGDLFEAKVEAIVNPVNCVGVMGGGLALGFKNRYPEMFLDYKEECDAGRLVPGRMHLYDNSPASPRWVINFPTKRHWKQPSRLDDVAAGLNGLAEVITRLEISSIAIPALGCGLGGLSWDDVRVLARARMEQLVNVDVFLYHP